MKSSKKHICDHCGKVLSRADKLRIHLLNVHGINLREERAKQGLVRGSKTKKLNVRKKVTKVLKEKSAASGNIPEGEETIEMIEQEVNKSPKKSPSKAIKAEMEEVVICEPEIDDSELKRGLNFR